MRRRAASGDVSVTVQGTGLGTCSAMTTGPAVVPESEESGRLCEGVELRPPAVRCRHLRLRELDIDLSDSEWETFSYVPVHVRPIRFRSSKRFRPAPADKPPIIYSPLFACMALGKDW